ncbi:outer membrane beta-barrel protein [Alteromonas sp. ASW11-130]|uniref:outer membrane beta-barrel protein n=1 Tax=Alteromonas sp. ASW11-130 TaxID=3015775 RepID=UPI002241C80A|nr:outer membrane beta-barrel protein [Alteromonas sp. ASW11-130]MCW8091098.1 porin family protein [Alteromonas sp. ASW11-130]
MKRTLLACSLAVFSNMALANWVGQLSYSSLSDDDPNADVSLGAIGASVGYRSQMTESFYLTPELRLGTGINEEELYGVELSIDNYYGVGIRGEYLANDVFYLLASAAYLKFNFDAEYLGYAVSEGESEFGVGIGAGYNINEKASIEATFETFDGVDLLNFGVRFKF